MEPSLTRPALGRRIALELRPARPATWIGPTWATICGALASGGFVLSGRAILIVAVAIILTDPILGAWRAAWVNTDWRRPMRFWRATPTRAWMLVPYARLDSPAARLSQWISSRAKFWREAIWPEVGQSLSALLVSGLIALTVAFVLGTSTVLFTILAMLLAPIEAEMQHHSGGRWPRAFAEVGAAWLIGHSALALATPTVESALMALLFVVAYSGLLIVRSSRELGFALSNLAQILVAITLVARGAFINAGFIGIGLVAQVLWQAAVRRAPDDPLTYLQRVQWFVLAAMLVAALGVPH